MAVDGDWSAGEPGATALFWNPGAISYVVELLLACVLAAYLAWRLLREARHGRLHAPTLLMAVLTASLVPAFTASLLRVMTAGGWVSYAMPWSPLSSWATLAMPWARPFAGLTAVSYAAFAYRFPRPLAGVRYERLAVEGLLAVLLVAEFAIAVRSDIAILRSEAWWRPDWIVGWMGVAMVWTAVVFARQFAAAQGGGVRSILRTAANREARVARGFLLFTLLPITYAITIFIPSDGLFGPYPLDIFICWVVLAQLAGVTLLLAGYLPERTSFLFKLTTICLALVLGAINGAAWMMAPSYDSQFRAPGMVKSGEALAFTPHATGYVAAPIPWTPQPRHGAAVDEAGLRVALPFKLRFYGRDHEAAYVSDRGVIAFDRTPQPVDAAFGVGVQPAIYPLLVDLPKAGGQVLVSVGADRLTVTRTDRCDATDAAGCYQVQTIVHADGRIEMGFLQVPAAPAFWLFGPLHAPWLLGVTPGSGREAHGAPLLRDYYRAYLAHLDRLFLPIVYLALGATVALLAGLPLLFRTFLVGPLGHLLDGIRRFRDGALDTQVEVSFADEIGYLTQSFNEMARWQEATLRELETRVADRVAEIGEMTTRNAQLEERNRLSADLHDAVAQTLSSASLLAAALPARLREGGADGVDAAERVAQLNRHALIEMEVLLRELRGADAWDRSLADRLIHLAQSVSQLHAAKIECEISGDATLPVEVRTMFYRVAQESLNNVVKHSGAGRAQLAFEAMEDRALLVVSDDGRGFDLAAMAGSERLGLAIMSERARQISADLEIETRPGEGCRVTMIWVRDRAD